MLAHVFYLYYTLSYSFYICLISLFIRSIFIPFAQGRRFSVFFVISLCNDTSVCFRLHLFRYLIVYFMHYFGACSWSINEITLALKKVIIFFLPDSVQVFANWCMYFLFTVIRFCCRTCTERNRFVLVYYFLSSFWTILFFISRALSFSVYLLFSVLKCQRNAWFNSHFWQWWSTLAADDETLIAKHQMCVRVPELLW